MLEHARNETLAGKVCVVSGSGNVAQYAVEKLLELDAKVVAMSDSSGTIYDSRGITPEGLAYIKHLKNIERGRIHEYVAKFGGEFLSNQQPWSIPCDAAFPCATQNEIDLESAIELVKNGCYILSEGANMPTTTPAVEHFQKEGVLYAPGKAANAGGVAISALEMSQNAMNMQWAREEVDQHLQRIMKRIHSKCVKHGTGKEGVNYVKGANVSGFVKVANTMLRYGVL